MHIHISAHMHFPQGCGTRCNCTVNKYPTIDSSKLSILGYYTNVNQCQGQHWKIMHQSCVMLPRARSPSVGAQCRRQHDTSIFSVWARHTDAARTSLVAVSRTHRFQAGCARLLMPAWFGAAVSFRLHPACRRCQPPPSSVVIILAACDPTYTAVHRRRSCVSGGWKPPLELSLIHIWRCRRRG